MNCLAEDILASDVWRAVIEEIDAQLWGEFNRVPLEDKEAQTRVRYCRWALDRIQSEIESRMRQKISINLKTV